MVGMILTLVVLAVAAWFLWSAKTDTGWDWQKGGAAVVAVALAVWAYIADGWDYLVSLLTSF